MGDMNIVQAFCFTANTLDRFSANQRLIICNCDELIIVLNRIPHMNSSTCPSTAEILAKIPIPALTRRLPHDATATYSYLPDLPME